MTQAKLLTQFTRNVAVPTHALLDEPGGTWEAISLPYAPHPPLLQRLKERLNGLGAAIPSTQINWYRVQVPDFTGNPGPHFLYIPRSKSDGRIDIYADSNLIYQSNARSQGNEAGRPLWIPLDDVFNSGRPREMTIRMQNPRGFGGVLSSLWIGDTATIKWRYEARDWLQGQLPAIGNSAFLGLGLFSFIVWLTRDRQPLYLLVCLISILSYVHSLTGFGSSQPVPIIDGWGAWLTINAKFWEMTAVLLLLHLLRWGNFGRRSGIIAGLTLCCSVLTMPVPKLGDATLAPILAQLIFLLLSYSAIALALRDVWRRRVTTELLLASWTLVGLGFGTHDILMRANLLSIEGIFLAPYQNLGTFFICAYILFDRYMAAHREVALANASLEQRLQDREAELTASHQRLRIVEQRALLGKERQRMTMDMHDGLGSALVSALRITERGNHDSGQIADLLRVCLDDLKLAIDSMEVVDTDLLLLLATLRFRLAPRLENVGLNLRWEIQDIPPINWLTPEKSLHILRILQEAFANIIKHAQATEIVVSTSYANDWVRVYISDNGRGFDVAHGLANGGKGLSNQQRRAAAVSSMIEWQSSETGTQFCLLLPWMEPGNHPKRVT